MFKKNDQSTKTLDSFPPEKTDYSYEVKFTLSTSNTKKIREVVAVRSRDSMSERNKLREKLSIDAKLERVADVVHITNANIDSPVVKVLAVVSKLNNKKIVVAGNEFATQELLDGAAQDVEATGKSPKKSELQNFQEVKPVDGNSSRAVFIGGAVDPSNKDRSNVVAPEVDAKITVLDESKELKDQKPFNAVPDKSFGLGGVIFKGRPIQVFDEQSKQTPVTGGEVFGAVIFATVPSVFNQSLVVNYSGNKFTVKYSREISSIEYKKRPDDIALISRLFLLSTISKLKEEMRDCLKELTEKFEKVKQIDINNIQQNSNQNLSKPNASKKIKDSNNKLIIIFVRFLRLTLYKTKVKFNEIKSATSDLSKKINNSFIRKTLKEKKIAVGEFFLALRPSKIKVKFDKSKSGMLVNLLGAQDSVNYGGKKKSSIEEFINAAWWMTEHFSSVVVKKIIGNFLYLTLLWVAVVLVVASLFYGLLAPVWGYPSLSVEWLWLLKGVVALLALFFSLLALNFKNMEDRVHNKILEETNEKLGGILSELTQTNANVASLNTNPEAISHVPELLLRHFDEVLHTKETVAGLEKVILARQREVTAQVHHVKEHQERARRAATAAAGGVFTGFFTFEVGERVFKFMHLIHGQDDRSMFFWLTTEAQQFANPDLVNAKKRMPPEMMKEAYDKCVIDNPNTHSTACKAIELKLDPAHIQDHFKKQYQQSEMQAYGILLSITLVVSLIAAAIGWRKPAEEQAGGHGGHH